MYYFLICLFRRKVTTLQAGLKQLSHSPVLYCILQETWQHIQPRDFCPPFPKDSNTRSILNLYMTLVSCFWLVDTGSITFLIVFPSLDQKCWKSYTKKKKCEKQKTFHATNPSPAWLRLLSLIWAPNSINCETLWPKKLVTLLSKNRSNLFLFIVCVPTASYILTIILRSDLPECFLRTVPSPHRPFYGTLWLLLILKNGHLKRL